MHQLYPRLLKNKTNCHQEQQQHQCCRTAINNTTMKFTLVDIRSDVLHIYEKGRRTRKASGYHVYLRNVYRSWSDLSEEDKMSLIRPALRRKLIERLRSSGILGSNFVENSDNPFHLAPFTSSDFKGDMHEVVSIHWNRFIEEMKKVWQERAICHTSKHANPKLCKFGLSITEVFGKRLRSRKATI